MMNWLDSVAMMGGMLSRRMSEKLKTPTASPTRIARAIPIGIMAGSPFMNLMATVADRTIVEGMDRSMLPGPSVMTNIWPMATMVEKLANFKAAVARPGPA